MSDGEDDFAIARSLLSQRKSAEAFNHLIKAKAAAAGDWGRLHSIADAMSEADQHRSALELRYAIAAANPDDVALQLAYLRTRTIASGNDDAELRTVESSLDALVVRLSPFSAESWLLASEIFRMSRAPSKRVAAARRALALDRRSLHVMRQVAHFHAGDGRRWQAWWILRKLSRRPDLPQPFMAELSYLSRVTGCHSLAIRFARRLQALAPKDLDAVVLEAKAFQAKGQGRRAASLIKARLDDFWALQDHGHLALQAAPVLLAGGELDAERSLLVHAAASWPDNRAVATALEVAQFGTSASSWTARA